jgi:hypothetical protein
MVGFFGMGFQYILVLPIKNFTPWLAIWIWTDVSTEGTSFTITQIQLYSAAIPTPFPTLPILDGASTEKIKKIVDSFSDE